MQSKSRRTLMALLGAYLIYNGVKLIMDVSNGNPNYKTALIAFGVIFVVFGAATMIMNLKELLKELKAEKNEVSPEEEETSEPVRAGKAEDGTKEAEVKEERVWKAPVVADVKTDSDDEDAADGDEDDEVMLDEDAEPFDDEPDYSQIEEDEWDQ